MAEVLVRQWGPGTYATYVDLGDRFPTFVGIEPTEAMALAYALSVLADPGECSKRRCCVSDLSGESETSERAYGGKWSEDCDGPRNSTTPARRPAPDSAGATP